MVNDDLFDNKYFLSYLESKEIINQYVKNNMNEFILKEDENFGMFFHLKYEYRSSSIYLLSDRGSLNFKLIINNQEIDLFQFEPLIVNLEWFSSKNILFLLKTIERYLIQF